MKVNSISNSMVNKSPQFKSAFPVVHWVAESNGSYAPVANSEILKKLQGKIIRMLNKPLSESTKPMNTLEQRLRAYIGRCDMAYRNMPVVRSFYNRTEAYPDRYTHLSYIITGEDVELFDEAFAKNIGRAKGVSDKFGTDKALRLYNANGLNFVKDMTRQIYDERNVPYVLHTKYEIVRNKLGKIKDYRFLEARFLPVNEHENRLGKM